MCGWLRVRVCKHTFVKIWVSRSSLYSGRVSVTLPDGHFYVEKNISVCTTRWRAHCVTCWTVGACKAAPHQPALRPFCFDNRRPWASQSSTIHSTVALSSTSEILTSAFPKDCIICTSKNKGVFCCCCVYVFACIAWDGQLVGSPAARSVWKEQMVQRCKPKRNSVFWERVGRRWGREG